MQLLVKWLVSRPVDTFGVCTFPLFLDSGWAALVFKAGGVGSRPWGPGPSGVPVLVPGPSHRSHPPVAEGRVPGESQIPEEGHG